MALVTPPIDYAACRKALVAAIEQATGLDNTRILRAMAQGPVQPRPPRPFATFQYRNAAIIPGYRDTLTPADDPTLGPTAYYYSGHRGMHVELNFFSDDQDEAYGLAATMQSALFQAPTREILAQAGLATWTIEDATDVSALLGTGYEARCLLEFEMYLMVHSLVDLGAIEHVYLVGQITAGDGPAIETEQTVNLTEEG